MKKQLFYILSFLFLFTLVDSSHAQFEGKVVYETYELSTSGDKTATDQFTMYVTPDRILLQGSNKYNFMGNIKTEGVLIRMDFEDFVFLTGDTKALKFSKADITSFQNMFGDDNDRSNAEIETDVKYRRTGETQTINGYKCEKFIFGDNEGDNHAEVWMTKALKINWGMLGDSWGKKTEAIISSGLPFSLIFEDGYFPLKMDSYENDRLKMVTVVKELSQTTIARAMVQVPSGVKVLSFQDYLFQKLSEQ